jgi:hypothetical protein
MTALGRETLAWPRDICPVKADQLHDLRHCAARDDDARCGLDDEPVRMREPYQARTRRAVAIEASR